MTVLILVGVGIWLCGMMIAGCVIGLDDSEPGDR